MNQVDDGAETEYSSDVDKSFMSRKTVSETQETEYGIGFRVGERRKSKGRSEVPPTGEILEEKCGSEEAELAGPFTLGRIEDREDLIKWAARLELESLSLKELVRSGVGEMLRQGGLMGGGDSREVAIMMERMERSVQQLAKQQREATRKHDRSQIETQIQVRLDELVSKLDRVEKEVAGSGRAKLSSKRAEQRGMADLYGAEDPAGFATKVDLVRIEEKMSQHIDHLASLIDSSSQKYDEAALRYDQKLRKFIGETSERVHKQVGTKIVVHGKKMESIVGVAQKKSAEQITHTHEELQQSIQKYSQLEDIKTFLSLLVPRLVGLEESFGKLRSNFDVLANNTIIDAGEDTSKGNRPQHSSKDRNNSAHKKPRLT